MLIPDGVTVRQLASLLSIPVSSLESFLTQKLGQVLHSDLEGVSWEDAELAAMEYGRVAIRLEAEREGGGGGGCPW